MAAEGVASAIFEFLADPVATSCMLPKMTAAQRKSMKKLIQQHPEIRSESYGFGEDRQLYLFKCVEDSNVQPLTPASLAKMEESRGLPLTRLPCSGCSSNSTAAPSETSSEHNQEVSLPTRNTFIHFEDTEFVDERAIQSMPRNMFRNSMYAERLQRAAKQPSGADNVEQARSCPVIPEAEPKEQAPLTLGALVVVNGLVKCPAFNGQSAIVQGWDEATGRFDILIACPGAEGGFQQAKVKEENLRMVLPNAVVYQ